MQQRTLGRQGLEVSALGLGCMGMTFAYSGGADPAECEATLLEPYPEGGTRGHLAADEAKAAFEASGAKRLLLTHRPQERPLDPQFEQVHDGQEIDV